MRDFKLSKQFISEYEGKQPEWGPLGYVVYKRTYARTQEDGTTEEYWETVKRVVEGAYSLQKQHCRNLGLPWNNDKAHRSAQEMFRRIWEFKLTPPGRGFWMMGTDYIDKIGSAPLQNCGMISTANLKTSLPEPFIWAMDMLMLGVGVGFDTLGAGYTVQKPKQGDYVFTVEDSREGWVAAVERVLTTFQGLKSLPTEFDYSQIRAEGAPIKGFGGTSSGHKPLKELIDSLLELLQSRVGEELTSVDISDMFCMVGRCVVSGNVRRSALLALGSSEDSSFMQMKDPILFPDKNKEIRWASNNSISAEVGMDYHAPASSTALNGEPGYIWLSNMRKYGRMKDPPDWSDKHVVGVNPCGEISLENAELCNLVETFPARHESIEDYKKTLKYAYLYAKSVTLLPTHNELTNAVMMKNRRIGCSMSGIAQAIAKFGVRSFLEMADEGYKYICHQDDIYSSWLCVPKSKKRTTCKPSGSVSLLCGATPGIHFPHSEYYIRRIRFNENSPMVDALKLCGYRIEQDKYSPNTVVVEFPVKEKDFARSKKDVTLWEQMELAAQVQAYWADNQVSATVTFSEDEAKDIEKALSMYETRLKSISFLPIQEHGYEQAPYEEITEETYNFMVENITPEALPEMLRADSSVHDKTEKFCTTDKCDVDFDEPQENK